VKVMPISVMQPTISRSGSLMKASASSSFFRDRDCCCELGMMLIRGLYDISEGFSAVCSVFGFLCVRLRCARNSTLRFQVLLVLFVEGSKHSRMRVGGVNPGAWVHPGSERGIT
jgi:hypothetical protein